jgi:hypothetical protein
MRVSTERGKARIVTYYINGVPIRLSTSQTEMESSHRRQSNGYLLVLHACIGLFVVIDENAQLAKQLKLANESQEAVTARQFISHASTATSRQLEQARAMTAKDIAAGNLQRQVTRAPKSWANIRERLETHADPEVERSKRVEKFLGDSQ